MGKLIYLFKLMMEEIYRKRAREENFSCQVFKNGSYYLLWDADDAITLRYVFRILGSALGKTGTMMNEKVYDAALPICLLPEQVYIGIKHGFIKLYDGSFDTFELKNDEIREKIISQLDRAMKNDLKIQLEKKQKEAEERKKQFIKDLPDKETIQKLREERKQRSKDF